ncbi:MAG: hypothetical protein ACRCX8_05515 [Sarcina sp.]
MMKLFNEEMMVRKVSKFLDMEANEFRYDYMEDVVFRGKDGTSIIHNGEFDIDRFLDLLLDVKIGLERVVEYPPSSLSALLRYGDVKFKYIAKRVSKYNIVCREALETYFRFVNKFDLHSKIYTDGFDFIDWIDVNRAKIETSIKIKIDKEFKLIITFE